MYSKKNFLSIYNSNRQPLWKIPHYDATPPSKLQIAIAFGKYATGTIPGDEMWCEYDQEALDYCTAISKTGGDF